MLRMCEVIPSYTWKSSGIVMRTVKVSELMVSFVHKFAVYVVICLWINMVSSMV